MAIVVADCSISTEERGAELSERQIVKALCVLEAANLEALFR
jgi:hypothetical protein